MKKEAHITETVKEKLSKFDKFAKEFGEIKVSREYWAKEQKRLDRNMNYTVTNGQEPINIIEAIKELEDLQNRTCDNCKFLDMDLICTNENTPCCSEYSGRYDNFGCSEWEQK